MDLFQNQNPPAYQDPHYQNYKYYCHVCHFGASFIELMQYHYAFHCKRYFYPVTSQSQQHQTPEYEYQDHQKHLQLQQYTHENRSYEYYAGTKTLAMTATYPSSATFMRPKAVEESFVPQSQPQAAFSVGPELPPDYYYSYKQPELVASASTYITQDLSASATVTSTIPEAVTTAVPESEDPLPGPLLSEWVNSAVTSLSFSNIDFPCPFSRDFEWDADQIDLQAFDPPLPSVGQVDSVESQFYAFEQGLTDTYDDLGNNNAMF